MFLTFLFYSSLLCACLCSCSPTRKLQPLGTIPPVRPVSSEEEQYGHQILEELTDRYKLDYNHPKYPTITAIVDKLTKAINASQQPWHVYLFNEDSVQNAAATRGNHIFIWTGMLNLVKNDDQLAMVLAHEMAHVIARHTDPDPDEELKKILIQLGASAAGLAISIATQNPNLGSNLGQITSTVTEEVGKGIFLNQFSKELELEADQIGMMIAAEAGYNPQAAIDFWQSGANQLDIAPALSFFSTHPPAADRIEHLKKALPLALARYQKLPNPTEQVTTGRDAANSLDPDSFDFRYKRRIK